MGSIARAGTATCTAAGTPGRFTAGRFTPGRLFTDFAAEQANLPPGAFKAVLMRAAGRMQAEMRVTTAGGTARAVERWTWPDTTWLQAALRERLMAVVVAPGEHAHA